MRKILYALIACVAFCAQSCQESLEDKAEREAKEYTKSFCPTPTVNYTRTDSVVFYKSTKSYTYYCSFSDYKEAGFKFVYIVHSTKEPTKILYQDSFSFTK